MLEDALFTGIFNNSLITFDEDTKSKPLDSRFRGNDENWLLSLVQALADALSTGIYKHSPL